MQEERVFVLAIRKNCL